MTKLERLQRIRTLVWELYLAPSFEKEMAICRLCDEAIAEEIGLRNGKEKAA